MDGVLFDGAVSSGLTSRPSLSEARRRGNHARPLHVSSGLTSRPSLSGGPRLLLRLRLARVVGINLPTFVERRRWWRRCRLRERVVGINLPTFVERSTCSRRASPASPVSSGLTSRPSLSVAIRGAGVHPHPGVVGINLPTFVERRWSWRTSRTRRPGVVGINLPTFVERACPSSGPPAAPTGVVGINLPTFVERPCS